MSKLKGQTIANTVTPAQATMTWPPMQMPPVHPVFGMTQDHMDALHAWYDSVQGAVHERLTAMSTEIENLKSQLKTQNKA